LKSYKFTFSEVTIERIRELSRKMGMTQTGFLTSLVHERYLAEQLTVHQVVRGVMDRDPEIRRYIESETAGNKRHRHKGKGAV
jgi:hypothetical protein